MLLRRLVFVIALSLAGAEIKYDEYDMVLQTDDIEKIAAEKKIGIDISGASGAFKEHISRKFDSFPARVLGIVGMFNKGKTWFINNLFGRNFRSGTSHTTKGISFTYMEQNTLVNDKWLVLDTAGTHATIAFKGSLKGKDRMEFELDRIAKQASMENFVFDLVTKVSQFLVFIVNDITWLEQKMQFDLAQKLMPRQQLNSATKHEEKNMVVVHNFRYSTKKVANHQFMNDVATIDDGQHDEDLIFTTRNGKISHFGFIDDSTIEGPATNAAQFEKLRLMAVTKTPMAYPKSFDQLIPLNRCLHKILNCGEEAEQPFDIDLVNDSDTWATISINKNDEKNCSLAQVAVLDDDVIMSENTNLDKPFKTFYRLQGYGEHEHRLVYQIDAPGVTHNGIRFDLDSSLSFWTVNFTRTEHAGYNAEYSPEVISHPPSYSGAEIQGKVWAYAKHSRLISRVGSQMVKMTQMEEAGYRFEPHMLPSRRCTDWQNQRKSTNNDWNKKLCKPWHLHNGILYVVAVKKPKIEGGGDPSLEGRRRRAHVDF